MVYVGLLLSVTFWGLETAGLEGHMAKVALMAAQWLAEVGVDEPFVVRNCKYEIIIIGLIGTERLA